MYFVVKLKSQKKFLSNKTEEVKFQLNSSLQSLVVPGIHDVTLLLQNNVSNVTYFARVTINNEIKNLNVLTKQYVGLQPNFFIISAKVSQGAPVNLSIDIKSIQTRLIVYKTSKFCPRDFHTMVVKATLFQPGMYELKAIAINNISQSTSSASFEVLPQIYDVYITSRGFDFETRR